MTRRTALLLALLTGAALAAPAGAHTPAKAEIVSPAEGIIEHGPTIDVRIRAVGGTSPAEFRLLLDGQPLDTSGRPDPASLFLDFRVASGETRQVTLSAAPGAHELRLKYKADAGHEPPDVVRRFTVAAPSARPTPTPSQRPTKTEDSSNTLVFGLILGVVVAIAGAAVRAKRAASHR